MRKSLYHWVARSSKVSEQLFVVLKKDVCEGIAFVGRLLSCCDARFVQDGIYHAL